LDPLKKVDFSGLRRREVRFRVGRRVFRLRKNQAAGLRGKVQLCNWRFVPSTFKHFVHSCATHDDGRVSGGRHNVVQEIELLSVPVCAR